MNLYEFYLLYDNLCWSRTQQRDRTADRRVHAGSAGASEGRQADAHLDSPLRRGRHHSRSLGVGPPRDEDARRGPHDRHAVIRLLHRARRRLNRLNRL